MKPYASVITVFLLSLVLSSHGIPLDKGEMDDIYLYATLLFIEEKHNFFNCISITFQSFSNRLSRFLFHPDTTDIERTLKGVHDGPEIPVATKKSQEHQEPLPVNLGFGNASYIFDP